MLRYNCLLTQYGVVEVRGVICQIQPQIEKAVVHRHTHRVTDGQNLLLGIKVRSKHSTVTQGNTQELQSNELEACRTRLCILNMQRGHVLFGVARKILFFKILKRQYYAFSRHIVPFYSRIKLLQLL